MAADAIPLMSLRDTSSDHRDGNNPSSWLKARALHAWRFTVASGALAAIVILLVNIITITTICVKYPMSDNGVAFYTGSCETTKLVTTVSHLIINILSTILLAYSNFAMQCLNSPTRAEVDAAHAKQHWLNIGTPSIRNLFFVSRSKLNLWLVLGISSFPLHMFWNATVFNTSSTNDYLAVAVTPDFGNGTKWTVAESETLFAKSDKSTASRYRDIILGLQQKLQDNELEHLGVYECQQAYFSSVIPSRSNVLFIDGKSSATSPVLAIWDKQFISDRGNTYNWTSCDLSDGCFSSFTPWDPDFGSLTIGPVRECFSQETTEECKASLVPGFLVIVIVCNIIKACCFILTLRITKKAPGLCTLGDAIQSFLKEPDAYTQRRCLVSKKDYDSHWLGKSCEWGSRPTNIGDTWGGGRDQWFRSVNWLQYVIFSLSLVTIAIFSVIYHFTSDGDLSDVLGLPTVFFNSNTVFSIGRASMLTVSLVANIPQVLVSYVYLGLNNIMTTMLVMHEWCSYSTSSRKPAKGLRVTSPVSESEQRSTYFLSLPYRWSIPTTLIVTLVHWLVSVMFSFVQLDIHRIDSENTVTTMNYFVFNYLMLLLVVPIGLGAYGGLVLLSLFKKFPEAMPLAGCCSASIAAACQPPLLQGNELGSRRAFFSDLSNRKLKWGVVERPEETENGIGHATFSASNVTPLEEEKMYN